MTDIADDALWKTFSEVVRKVDAQNYDYGKAFTRETRVSEDLHLEGTPAFDLLEEIADAFNVDFSQFPFKRYFIEESFSVLPLFSFWKKEHRQKKRIMTLGMLEQAVKLGKWDTQTIDPD